MGGKVEEAKVASFTSCCKFLFTGGDKTHHVSGLAILSVSNARLYNPIVNSPQNAELPPKGLYLYADVMEGRLSYTINDLQDCNGLWLDSRLGRHTAHIPAAIVPEA